MIPLYGFLEGDTLGLLMLVQADTTLAELADKLRSAARLRADPGDRVTIWVHDRVLDPRMSVADAKLEPLDQFEVRRAVP